jgi:hypothetical protein
VQLNKKLLNIRVDAPTTMTMSLTAMLLDSGSWLHITLMQLASETRDAPADFLQAFRDGDGGIKRLSIHGLHDYDAERELALAALSLTAQFTDTARYLRVLRLQRCGLRATDIDAMVQFFLSFTWLRALSFSGNQFNGASLIELAEKGIAANNSVEYLDLSYCVGGSVYDRVACAIAAALRRNTTMSRLNIESNTPLSNSGIVAFLDLLRDSNTALHSLRFRYSMRDWRATATVNRRFLSHFLALNRVMTVLPIWRHAVALREGSVEDASGDFEALPNELIHAIAARAPTLPLLFTMGAVCRRLRACAICDYTLHEYSGGTGLTHRMAMRRCFGGRHLPFDESSVENPNFDDPCLPLEPRDNGGSTSTIKNLSPLAEHVDALRSLITPQLHALAMAALPEARFAPRF